MPSSIQTLRGILPPVAMPFDERGDIVTGAIKDQIDFLVEGGAHGVVAGGSTGEGHTLDTEEFTTAMHAAHEAVAGRVPFVAGLIVNSTREAIQRTQRLRGLDVVALQVTPVHYLFKPGPEETIRHFREIYDETGIPILIYNVIPWNYLGVDLMLRVMEEVPGVVGMKQSSGDLKSLSDLMGAVKPGNVVYTGIDALLYPAFSLGAHGAISALTTAVPKTCVALWEAMQRGDHETARGLHFHLSRLWNAMTHDNLPACVKYVQHRQGLTLHPPRRPMASVSPEQRRRIDAALEGFPL